MKHTVNFAPADFDIREINVKLLGDSITHGVGGTGFAQSGEPIVAGYKRNPDGFCWAKLMKEYLETNRGCHLTNNACTGTNVEFIIKHFDTLVSDEDDLVICTIGTNNRHQYKNTGERRTVEDMGETFYNNVLKLHGMFREKGKKVIFVANIPASPKNEEGGDDFWRILHMDDINAIYKHAALKAGFPLISMYELFSEYLAENNVDINSLLDDGLHPNDEGYRVMFSLLSHTLGINE